MPWKFERLKRIVQRKFEPQIIKLAPVSGTNPSACKFLVNFGLWDGSGTLQEIEIASLVSLLDVLHV
jgi:hypothetical protein